MPSSVNRKPNSSHIPLMLAITKKVKTIRNTAIPRGSSFVSHQRRHLSACIVNITTASAAAASSSQPIVGESASAS